jgi:hypothetical protein
MVVDHIDAGIFLHCFVTFTCFTMGGYIDVRIFISVLLTQVILIRCVQVCFTAIHALRKLIFLIRAEDETSLLQVGNGTGSNEKRLIVGAQ